MECVENQVSCYLIMGVKTNRWNEIHRITFKMLYFFENINNKWNSMEQNEQNRASVNTKSD